MELVTKVDQMGRTSIPAEIRKILEVGEGDEVVWQIKGDKIVIEKKTGGKSPEEVIQWLRKNAPKCFTWEPSIGEPKTAWDKIKEAAEREWAMKKLGLKE